MHRQQQITPRAQTASHHTPSGGHAAAHLRPRHLARVPPLVERRGALGVDEVVDLQGARRQERQDARWQEERTARSRAGSQAALPCSVRRGTAALWRRRCGSPHLRVDANEELAMARVDFLLAEVAGERLDHHLSPPPLVLLPHSLSLPVADDPPGVRRANDLEDSPADWPHCMESCGLDLPTDIRVLIHG